MCIYVVSCVCNMSKYVVGVYLLSTGLWVPVAFMSLIVGLPVALLQKHFVREDTSAVALAYRTRDTSERVWTLDDIMCYLSVHYSSLLCEVRGVPSSECAVCFESKSRYVVCQNGHTCLCTSCDFRSMCVGLLERLNVRLHSAAVVASYWDDHIRSVRQSVDASISGSLYRNRCCICRSPFVLPSSNHIRSVVSV